MQSRVLLKILATSILAATPAYAALDNYWALDEASGTNIPNSVGGGTNGTLFSGATWVTDGTRGQVLSFDGGVNGYADLGLIPQISTSGGYSWSFWSYDEENVVGGSNNIILGNRFAANGSDPLRFTKFTTRQFEFFASSGPEPIDYADQPSLAWTHNSVIKGGNSFVYFRNGLYAGRRNFTGDMGGTLPLYLGGDRTQENWKGRIDDVATWSNAVPVSSVARIAAGTQTPGTASATQAPMSTVFSDNFSSGLGSWAVTNRGLEQNGAAGYNAPSTAGGTLSLSGTTTNQFWFGSSVETTISFDATKENWITVDRLSLSGTGSAYRSSLWILGDDQHYLHFSENIGEGGWTFNARDDGGSGTNNPTGGGVNLPDADFLEGGGSVGMGIRLVPTGQPGDMYAYMYLNGQIYGSQFFSNFPDDFTVVLTGQARAIGDSVNAQFDNFSVQQVPEPTSALLLLLGGVTLLGARRRRA